MDVGLVAGSRKSAQCPRLAAVFDVRKFGSDVRVARPVGLEKTVQPALHGLVLGIRRKGRLWAIVTIVAYVATLDALALEGFVDLLGFQFPLGSFEPATIVAMSVLLRVFWTDRLFPILVMATGWTLCLSLSFRGLFNIPLPG